MMKVVNREELVRYNPIILGLVAQENARGDNLNVTLLQQDLIHGNQFMLVFAKEEAKPLLALLCQGGMDRVRGTKILWVHNFHLADREAFDAADWTAEAQEFDRLAGKYDKVSFMTDSPALLKFLGGLGYYATATGIICDLTKDATGAIDAAQAAKTLEG